MTTYIVRPGRLDDLEQAVRMFNLTSQKMTGADEWTLEDGIAEWTSPSANIDEDTRVAVTPDGEILGVVELWNVSPPYVKNNVWARVHPDYEGQGIGTELMMWAETRAYEKLPLAESDTRVVLSCGTRGVNTEAKDLFEGRGFHQVRSTFTMERIMDTPPEDPVVPHGMVVRPINVPDEYAEFHRVDMEAFRDHWGFVERPFETTFADMMHYVDEGVCDPSIWFVAMNGDRMAGVAMCEPKSSSDPEAGYAGTLAVRKEFRHRGVGTALLLYAFSEFYRRGQRKVHLDVDANNLTGALQLYQKAGMHILRRFDHYEKVLRNGRDLMTRG